VLYPLSNNTLIDHEDSVLTDRLLSLRVGCHVGEVTDHTKEILVAQGDDDHGRVPLPGQTSSSLQLAVNVIQSLGIFACGALHQNLRKHDTTLNGP
jgi:hypothetical protein